MKRLLPLLLVAVCLAAHLAIASPPPEPPAPGTAPACDANAATQKRDVRPLENYEQILAVLPANPPAKEARDWTLDEKTVANSVFNEVLVTPRAPARFKVRVGQIARWPGLTLFVDVPNKEGYHVRIFGGFSEEWAARLKQLKKGDEVILEGTFSHVAFEDVWNAPTLSICLTGSSFVPTPAAKSRHADILIMSAVYGSGTSFVDVTARVNGLVHQPEINFAAKPQWLLADPTPGRNKTLVIVYDFKGRKQVYAIGEGGRVNADILATHASNATQKEATPISADESAKATDQSS